MAWQIRNFLKYICPHETLSCDSGIQDLRSGICVASNKNLGWTFSAESITWSRHTLTSQCFLWCIASFWCGTFALTIHLSSIVLQFLQKFMCKISKLIQLFFTFFRRFLIITFNRSRHHCNFCEVECSFASGVDIWKSVFSVKNGYWLE